MENVNQLISAEQIQAKLAEIGAAVSRDYEGKQLLMLGVLKGAFILMADLARKITIPVDMEFMALSSYGNATKSSGAVRILKDLDQEIADRHVLIVEDILDTGLTLSYLIKNLRVRQPASIEIAALLIRKEMAKVPINCKYVGFGIGPEFVVGYGLDYAGLYRNLPYIGVLDAHQVT